MTVERRSAIEPLAPEWDELADRTAAMPWVRPGWIAAWRRAFGHGALQLLTVRQGGRLCGVLPLERRFGELRSPTNPQTPGFCLLAKGSAIRRTLANLLLCQQPRGIDTYGPGMLLRYEMLARAFRLGVRTYEFLGSDDAWKLEWTNDAREMTLLHAFAPSIAGLMDWAVWSYGRPAGRRVLRRGPR
jgi:CelD/BcsL family acetyltransferase involved in cellulose biosynthesis